MHSSYGFIELGPKLSHFTKARPWWMILKCDRGLMSFYRRLLLYEGIKTSEPLAQCHISIFRGEQPKKNSNLWNTLSGTKISFTYDGEIKTNGKHWWVDVESKKILEIRQCFGFGPPKHPLHMTFGVTV